MDSMSWFMALWNLCKSYPKLLLTISCFIIILSFRRKDQIPTNWPIVGMLPSLLLNLHHPQNWLTRVLTQTGCTFLFHGPWFTGMDILFTCDPANANHFFRTNISNFPKGPDILEIFDIFGDGVINSDWSLWEVQRKIAHNLLARRSFRKILAKSSREKVENGLISVLEHIAQQGLVVDLQDVFQRFTFDSTCNLVFGVDPHSLSIGFPMIPFAKAIDDASEAIFFRSVVPEFWWKLQRWLRIGEEKKMADAWKKIDHFIGQHILMRREALKNSTRNKEGENEGTDLLTSFMDYQLEDEVVSTNSDKFLRDNTLNFMAAGRDTTSAALTWFFWLISENPSVESKIVEELKANLAENEDARQEKPWVFDSDELNGLVYLHAALCETLRLYPPIPIVNRGVVHPDVLPSGEVVRRSTKIMFSLYAMGRMEGIWGKDCLEFKPERWIIDGGKLRLEPSYKYIGFNAGPRTCLGKETAFTQMKAVIAALLYNYHVEIIPGQVVNPKMGIGLLMQYGLMVKLRKRYS